MAHRLILVVALVALLTQGCGPTATDLPLPGGGLSGDTYEVQAEFADVLNLPHKAKVTLEGVEIGQVSEVEAEGYTAIVTLRILEQFELPVGTTLQLRQATALGEVFVAVTFPDERTRATIAPGDTIPLAQTGSAPSIEDTLAALSMLLNGGGLSNLKTIVDELNITFEDNAPALRRVLRQLTTTASVLNSRSAEITRILEAADKLMRQVVDRQDSVDALIRASRPAVRLLREETGRFVEMLSRFEELADSGRALVQATRGTSVRMLARLQPVLDGFIAIDEDLAPALDQMLAFHEAIKRISRGSVAAGTLELRGVQLSLLSGALPELASQGGER